MPAFQTGNQHTFHINYTASDGTVLEGQFTCKRLSVLDRSKIGVRKSQLNGGMFCVRDEEGKPTGQGIDEELDNINSLLATLEVSLTQQPVWFDLKSVYDLGVAIEVYKKVNEYNNSFFRSANGESADQSGGVRQGNSGAQPQRSGPGNSPTPVVGKEVQAALDA